MLKLKTGSNTGSDTLTRYPTRPGQNRRPGDPWPGYPVPSLVGRPDRCRSCIINTFINILRATWLCFRSYTLLAMDASEKGMDIEPNIGRRLSEKKLISPIVLVSSIVHLFEWRFCFVAILSPYVGRGGAVNCSIHNAPIMDVCANGQNGTVLLWINS